MKVLCYVNHYFGEPVGFEGRSTDQSNARRQAIVEACIAGLRSIPDADVKTCGIRGRALVTVDVDFPQIRDDPRLLIYESLAHMAGRLDEYDYFINVEDDVLVPPETFANVLAFDQDSLVNEVLHPNRIEEDESGHPFCVDLRAMPGWTYQRRSYVGHELRVALNPHSALLILSRDKLRYALRHVDTSYRGRFLNYEMDSAFAYYHSPLCLYRPYEDLTFHTVTHLDRWAGPRSRAQTSAGSPGSRRRMRRLLRELVPPIVAKRRRRSKAG